MGLIQELSRYLEAKYDPEGLIAENDRLRKENAEYKEKYCLEFSRADKQQEAKESALNELILCQKRIDALLRQLSEKNGGQR